MPQNKLHSLTPHKSISRKLHILKLQCLVSDQIAEGSFLLHPGSFFAVTEIEDSDETFVSFLAEDAENAVIMNIVCIYITVLIKNRFLAADLLHAAKSLEDLSLNGGFGVSFSGKLPLESTTVDMFTTVYIGNAATRAVSGWMVTPRGYRK